MSNSGDNMGDNLNMGYAPSGYFPQYSQEAYHQASQQHGYNDYNMHEMNNQPQYPAHSLENHSPVTNEPVVTYRQNYQADLPALTQIQNTMARMQLQLDQAQAEAAAAKVTATMVQQAHEASQKTNRKAKMKRDVKKARLQSLIQSKARWLLNIGGRDDDDNIITLLPHPLRPGEEAQLLADGKTPRAHPIWSKGVTDPVNAHYIHKIANVVMEHVERDNIANTLLYNDPSVAIVLTYTKNFFRTLRRNYHAQTTEEGRRRQQRKLQHNKIRARKHEKADDHRTAIAKFREIHGEENTVGDFDAVQTDDMSSEHSDPGKAPMAIFNTYRRQSGGGDNGWEVRKKGYASSWLRLFHAHLKTIRRDMLSEKTQLGASGSKGGKHRVPRFKGLLENVNDNNPLLIRKKPLYESMVSKSWMQKKGVTPAEIGAIADPQHLTIFSLKLDRTGLNDVEISYLSDESMA